MSTTSINGHTIDPNGVYDVKTVITILNCKRSTIHAWIKSGRLAEPLYPLGKENTRSPHFWRGNDLLKCFLGVHFKEEAKS